MQFNLLSEDFFCRPAMQKKSPQLHDSKMAMEEERPHQCSQLSVSRSLFSLAENQQEPTRPLFRREDADLSSTHVQAQPMLHYSSVFPSTEADDNDALRTRAGWRRSLELQSNGGQPAGLPADRYFDALEGPELDILKASEEPVLPEDKIWPFLLRFPVSAFGVCMGVGSQSILWKTLAESPSTEFLGISPAVNFVLWCAAAFLVGAVSVTYVLKAFFYLEAIPREFYHPVRVNFFFAPWVACLFLLLGLPPSISLDRRVNGLIVVWYALMAPILFLELKIYGQWMFGGRRRLSKVANPSNHLSIVGNFVGALLGASLGLKEGPIFFFSVGLAHYAVLLVTLYQRLPTNETLPKELHPVFFLFVAVPTAAAMAWARIRGTFDYVCRIPYFLGLFLYASLAVRINFFRGFRFSLTWWAYTFPMTDAAIATIWYAAEVRNPLTRSLSLILSAVSTVTMIGLLISTAVHGILFGDLFPNDLSIAVAEAGRRNLRVNSFPSPPGVGEHAAIPTDLSEPTLY